jgi:anti-sigma regulatory factor (Ser/Thr protein kinase)
MGLGTDLPPDLGQLLPRSDEVSDRDLGLRRLLTAHDVEDAARDAVEVVENQVPTLAVWGGPVHMAVSELCDNALQHGYDAIGGYVAADRVEGDRYQFRLAIADLGIGIPEHIRSRHPEWQDDTAAITRALQRGVTGTDDIHRGNGFAEVFDDASHELLKRENSSVRIDIRSAKGRVVVDFIDGRTRAEAGSVVRSRRGTWITYTVTSVT